MQYNSGKDLTARTENMVGQMLEENGISQAK